MTRSGQYHLFLYSLNATTPLLESTNQSHSSPLEEGMDISNFRLSPMGEWIYGSFGASFKKGAAMAINAVLTDRFQQNPLLGWPFLLIPKVCGIALSIMRVKISFSTLLGCFLVFWQLPKRFIHYLKTDGPPSNELELYMQQKNVVISYIGVVLALKYSFPTGRLLWWLLRLSFIPGSCVSVALCALLAWDSRNNSRRIREKIGLTLSTLFTCLPVLSLCY
jgi:hypothetical protein